LVQPLGIHATSSPNTFRLNQNFPNPFNGQTEITYTVPENQEITLTIHNSTGEKICDLIANEYVVQGTHKVNWNSAGYSSGVYFYTLHSRSTIISKAMILIK